MENELVLLRRLITLQRQRADLSKNVEAGLLTLEEIASIEKEISEINRQLWESYGY